LVKVYSTKLERTAGAEVEMLAGKMGLSVAECLRRMVDLGRIELRRRIAALVAENGNVKVAPDIKEKRLELIKEICEERMALSERDRKWG
jgi:hypothetical protein